VLGFVLAFLLSNGLVARRWLFFTDGHRALQNTIAGYLHARGFGEEELRDIVFTAGFVPHAEINLIYSLAEFFVLTTLCESFALRWWRR
jgi:hypothetical protein